MFASRITSVFASSDRARAFGRAPERAAAAAAALARSCGRESRRGSLAKENHVLDIYPVILSFVEDASVLIGRIGHHDPDLARQLRRASTSVALNTSEAMYARGRSRTASYNVALREMRESYAALEIAVRLHYVPTLELKLEDRIQRILGTLYRLSFLRTKAP